MQRSPCIHHGSPLFATYHMLFTCVRHSTTIAYGNMLATVTYATVASMLLYLSTIVHYSTVRHNTSLLNEWAMLVYYCSPIWQAPHAPATPKTHKARHNKRITTVVRTPGSAYRRLYTVIWANLPTYLQ